MSHRNAINWFEIPVLDMDRAERFYTAVIGAPLQREEMPVDGQTYSLAVFPAEGEGAKGCLQTGSTQQASASHGTLVYLACGASLDAALQRATAQGGAILKPKTALPPGMGFFALIQDLDGNCVGLHALA